VSFLTVVAQMKVADVHIMRVNGHRSSGSTSGVRRSFEDAPLTTILG
jgi:hypothetical protein